MQEVQQQMAGKDGMEVDVSSLNESENVENTDTRTTESEKTERLVKLPLTRIKHIMKMDPDVNLASQEAVILIAKATVSAGCRRHSSKRQFSLRDIFLSTVSIRSGIDIYCTTLSLLCKCPCFGISA